MNNTPSLQRKIFGLNSYFDEIIRLFELNKLPNKILLSGPKGSGKSTLAYHLINYIFSKDEVDKYNINKNEIIPENRSFKLISSNSHTNFYLIDLIDDKKNIEISQIRKMIEYSNLSSFNNQPKFILINNVENLNPNSLNARSAAVLSNPPDQKKSIVFPLSASNCADSNIQSAKSFLGYSLKGIQGIKGCV